MIIENIFKEKPNYVPILEKFIKKIGSNNMYYGNRIPDSIMKQITIEIELASIGVVAPYWLGVLESGRGPRIETKDYGLWKKIYRWMEHKNLFESKTSKGKRSEAKSVTWYLNKYGNQQFRNKTFVEIYTKAREEAINEITTEFETTLDKITFDIL